jgi:hypothetical protein
MDFGIFTMGTNVGAGSTQGLILTYSDNPNPGPG